MINCLIVLRVVVVADSAQSRVVDKNYDLNDSWWCGHSIIQCRYCVYWDVHEHNGCDRCNNEHLAYGQRRERIIINIETKKCLYTCMRYSFLCRFLSLSIADARDFLPSIFLFRSFFLCYWVAEKRSGTRRGEWINSSDRENKMKYNANENLRVIYAFISISMNDFCVEYFDT